MVLIRDRINFKHYNVSLLNIVALRTMGADGRYGSQSAFRGRLHSARNAYFLTLPD
jgi:hypothetical protein